MALFKIHKGQYEDLPSVHKEGWMYITEDKGDIYLDISDNERIHLNADRANYVRDANNNLLNYQDLYNVIRSKSANGYWGMTDPAKSDSAWIRTTSAGLLPYQTGTLGNGHSSLGTANWRFQNAYIDHIYSEELNIYDIGKISYDNTNKFLVISGEDIDITESLYVEGEVFTDIKYSITEDESGNSAYFERGDLSLISSTNTSHLKPGNLSLESNDGKTNILIDQTGGFRVHDNTNGLYGTATMYMKPYLNTKVLLVNGIADEAKKLVQITNSGSVGYTIGSNTQPIYFDNGIPVPSSQTVGANTANAAKPIFMNAGTLTALSVSSGAADRPTYLKAGAITPTTYRMASTNVTATSAIAITSDLPTGIWYVSGTSNILGQSDGVCIANQYSSSWISEIYQDYRTGQLAVRGKNNGTWQPWRKILDDTNYSTTLDTRYVTLSTNQTITGKKTFSNDVILTKNVNYGSTLPSSPTEGQLFFMTSEENASVVIYEIVEV